MNIRLVCLVAALLALIFTRSVAAADVSCEEWLAYRAGDTKRQGAGPCVRGVSSGVHRPVNEYSDLLNRYVVLFRACTH